MALVIANLLMFPRCKLLMLLRCRGKRDAIVEFMSINIARLLLCARAIEQERDVTAVYDETIEHGFHGFGCKLNHFASAFALGGHCHSERENCFKMEQQSKIPIRRTGFNYNSENSSSPRNEAEKKQSRLSGKSVVGSSKNKRQSKIPIYRIGQTKCKTEKDVITATGKRFLATDSGILGRKFFFVRLLEG